MTNIAANPQAAWAAGFAQGFQAGGFAMAAGILAHCAKPLGAGPFAFALLPALFNIRCGQMMPNCLPQCPQMPEPKASWTTQMTGEHTANIDLGDGYKFQIDERGSEMYIINENTGQKTRVWGDPHVDVNGKRQFDFYGTTTFELENGAKVTINTEQWAGNPNAYVASQVVITKGSNAIVVDGISQNKLGDLSVTMSNDGYSIDAEHRDGWTVFEGANGWETGSGKVVDQNDADITAPGHLYGPGSTMPSLYESAGWMSSFLLLGALLNMGGGNSVGNDTPQLTARNFNPVMFNGMAIA
jgi:Domain of Unknown Function (DUF1521)